MLDGLSDRQHREHSVPEKVTLLISTTKLMAMEMRVSPDEIRDTAKVIADAAERWNEAVSAMSDAPAAAFGSDSVGRMIGSFNQKTHGPSVEYYQEVGKCTADMATALTGTADLYADTELDNKALAEQVGKLADEVGTKI